MAVFLYISLAVLAAAVLFWLKSNHKNQNAQKGLPPGPPRLPIIGNLHQMDFPNLHETFDRWSREYGEIASARVGSRTLILLNSYEMAKEALIRQGDTFSARPDLHVFDEITEGRGYVRSTGWVWKEQRRQGLHMLRDFGLGRSLQEQKIVEETEELFAELEKNMRPNPTEQGTKAVTLNPIISIKFAVVNIINHILFGERFPYGDVQFTEFQRLFTEVLLQTTNLFVVEFFPALRIFPFLFGQTEAKRRFMTLLNHYKHQIEKHRETLAEDLASGSPSDFTYAYLAEIERRNSAESKQPSNTFTEHQLAQNLSDLFAAGFETTATTLSWFLLYMVHYPDVQTKMRTEIQTNLPGQRSPEWSDRIKLPYTNAVIAELQRHANIVPTGVFHSCDQEAEIKGYRVPKNSIVVINQWTIMRDERLFRKATEFNPERFLAPDGSFSEKVDGFMPFSIGKRACMGESLARMELFLFATAIVMRYRLRPPPAGLPSMEPVNQFTLAPQPFELTLELNE